MKIDIFNTNKKYNIIYADPPWSYKDKKCNGNCESHYNINNVFYNEYNSTIRIYFEQDNMVLQVDSLNGYHHWCIKIDSFELINSDHIFKLYEKELLKNAIERNGY